MMSAMMHLEDCQVELIGKIAWTIPEVEIYRGADGRVYALRPHDNTLVELAMEQPADERTPWDQAVARAEDALGVLLEAVGGLKGQGLTHRQIAVILKDMTSIGLTNIMAILDALSSLQVQLGRRSAP